MLMLKQEIGCKCRSIEINLPQRCSAMLSSLTDIEEAQGAGSFAVQKALEGCTGQMITFARSEGVYTLNYGLEDVNKICNQEKKFPAEWIISNGTDIAEEFLDYVRPLIRGESQVPFVDGVPTYLAPVYKEQ